MKIATNMRAAQYIHTLSATDLQDVARQIEFCGATSALAEEKAIDADMGVDARRAAVRNVGDQAMKKLYLCESFPEQKAWVRERLLAGETLTDPFLYLSGIDPDRIIRALRREGLPIKTVRVRTVDAAGVEHPRTLAWRIEPQA